MFRSTYNSFRNYISYLLNSIIEILLWPPRLFKAMFLSLADYLLDTAKTTAQKLILIWIIIVTVVFTSMLLYSGFYMLYIPTAQITRPVHLSFSVCESGVGICSFPSANVSFWNDEGISRESLSSGQAYSMIVEMDLPDSYANRDLGMFMVAVKMFDRMGQVSFMSQRSTMLRYKSVVTRMMDLFLYSPLYLFGIWEQKHHLEVEMFSHYIDNYYQPSVGATVEVRSHKIEIYSCTLKLFAKFTGLKYFIYYWPFLSSLIAFWVNLSFLGFGLLIALYYKSSSMNAVAQALQLAKENRVEAVDNGASESNDSKENDDEDGVSSSGIPERTETTLQRDWGTQTLEEQEEEDSYADADEDATDDKLPVVQEPLDFPADDGDGDVDLINELRQRRIP